MISLFDLLLYIQGEQLRSCWDTQLLNHTVPGQAFWKQLTSTYLVPILLPVSDNLLFFNQVKREFFFQRKNVPNVRVELEAARLRKEQTTNRATGHKKV